MELGCRDRSRADEPEYRGIVIAYHVTTVRDLIGRDHA